MIRIHLPYVVIRILPPERTWRLRLRALVHEARHVATVAALAIGAAIGFTVVFAGLASIARAQNILLIQADDLGPDMVGCYGSPIPTPNLDGLAAGGLRFEKAYANAACSPTRATILTGQFAHRSGIGRAVNPNGSWGLDPRPGTLLPKALPPHYLKVAIGKWHLQTAPVGGEWHPVLCGFDLYVGSMANVGSYWNYPKTYASLAGAVTLPWSSYLTRDETDDAILALQVLRSSGRPWFLYVNYHAIHAPLHYPPGYSGRPSLDGRPEVAAMTQHLDAEIGRLLAAVDWLSTTVLFTGDNGTVEHMAPTPTLRGGKHSMYEGGIRVPLIAAGAQMGGNTGPVPDLVQSVDLYATILDLAGARVPQTSDSIPMTPILWNRSGWRSWVFCERFGPNGSSSPTEIQEAVRNDRWKLVLGETASHQFFDLWNDPLEQSPIPLSSLTIGQRAAYSELLARANSLGF